MKYLIILSLLTSPFALAQSIYEVPHSASATGTIKFERTKKGLIMHYPENIQVQKVGIYHQDAMISEAYCNKLLPTLVSQAVNSQNYSALYTSYPSQVVFSSFPFYGSKFEEHIGHELKKQGVKDLNFRYPIVAPEVSNLELIYGIGSLSNSVTTINVNEQYKYQITGVTAETRIESNYLPLICDLVTKSASIKLTWNANIMPFERDFQEVFSRVQVAEIYKGARAVATSLDGNTNTSAQTEKSFFLLGAVLGANFQKQVGPLSKENISNFTSLSQRFTDKREVKLKELSSKDLEQVYRDSLIDITKPLNFKGATYAN